MKAALLSFVAAALFVTTVASATAHFDHNRDFRRPAPHERARYEQQMRYERARWEAQHHHDRGPSYGYGYR